MGVLRQLCKSQQEIEDHKENANINDIEPYHAQKRTMDEGLMGFWIFDKSHIIYPYRIICYWIL